MKDVLRHLCCLCEKKNKIKIHTHILIAKLSPSEAHWKASDILYIPQNIIKYLQMRCNFGLAYFNKLLFFKNHRLSFIYIYIFSFKNKLPKNLNLAVIIGFSYWNFQCLLQCWKNTFFNQMLIVVFLCENFYC